MKKILVLGGTYFLGRHFLERFAEDAEVWMLNRGTVPVEELQLPAKLNMHLLMGDRHTCEVYQSIREEAFDAVVDFCGYAAGDVKFTLENLAGSIGQYVFISTVDVLERGTGEVLDSGALYENRDFGGEAGAYILGKVALEREVMECCGGRGTAYTIVRPSVIYGPYNYAPREGIYFHWVDTAGQVLLPQDATGWFQPVYVKDVADCLCRAVGNREVYDRILQICGAKVTYDSFYETLKMICGKRIDAVYSTVADLNERGIALPFPLLAEESEEYEENAAGVCCVEYTDFLQGLKETYEWYKTQ